MSVLSCDIYLCGFARAVPYRYTYRYGLRAGGDSRGPSEVENLTEFDGI